MRDIYVIMTILQAAEGAISRYGQSEVCPIRKFVKFGALERPEKVVLVVRNVSHNLGSITSDILMNETYGRSKGRF